MASTIAGVPERSLIVASNRGPVTFTGGEARRGVGGLVTAVGGAMRGREGAWVAAAMTDEDRERANAPFDLPFEGGSLQMRFAALDDATYRAYYDELSNRVLWFLHHYLFETARGPIVGPLQIEAWRAYEDVNRRFADLIATDAPQGAIALPQDYHLSLVPGLLRAARPDIAQAFFWHIPFCQPDQFRVLPDPWAVALLEGMLGADLIGFQSERWADNFVACCRAVLGARTRGRLITHAGRTARAGVYPVGVNVEHLTGEARQPLVDEAARQIEQIIGDRAMVLRVDRTELSKNILRGLNAFEALLERRPDLVTQVTHLVLLTPSRRNVPEYVEYMDHCIERANRINERFATDDWQPIIMEIADDFPRTLAAYRRYDVLVVNPVFDGMNLVAREGPLVNERDGTLVLSRNAGAAVELGPASVVVNPFDITETSIAIESALDMDPTERAERARRLRKRARGTSPERWLDKQISDLRRGGA